MGEVPLYTVNPHQALVFPGDAFKMRSTRKSPTPHTSPYHARRFGGLFQKSIFQEFQNTFRSKVDKRLQERANGSKNGPGMPPRRDFSGPPAEVPSS